MSLSTWASQTDSILVQVSADSIFQTSWGTEEHIVAYTLGINVEIIITERYIQALLSLVGGWTMVLLIPALL